GRGGARRGGHRLRRARASEQVQNESEDQKHTHHEKGLTKGGFERAQSLHSHRTSAWRAGDDSRGLRLLPALAPGGKPFRECALRAGAGRLVEERLRERLGQV